MLEMLSDQDRERFAAYLEREAASDEQMAEQCEKLGHAPMVKKLRAEAMAARIIASKLRSIETTAVSR
jgi:hypothetical protein